MLVFVCVVCITVCYPDMFLSQTVTITETNKLAIIAAPLKKRLRHISNTIYTFVVTVHDSDFGVTSSKVVSFCCNSNIIL